MKTLTYNPAVLALQGGAGAADGSAGAPLVRCCFANTAVESGAGTIGAGRRRAACEGGTGTHALAGYWALQWEKKKQLLHRRLYTTVLRIRNIKVK